MSQFDKSPEEPKDAQPQETVKPEDEIAEEQLERISGGAASYHNQV